jgi:antibiotic biosynthesis monooxygenase (ABM) superfamily enzyme
MLNLMTPETTNELVHVAVVRKVRLGREADFEAEIARFFGVAHQVSASGAYLIRPILGTHSREYGILRAFRSREEMQRFYASELYRQWSAAIAPLVEGEPNKRELQGLDIFFRPSGQSPARWKMAIVTYLAVVPAVYAFSRLVPAVFGTLPGLLAMLVVNFCVVASLTWILMPVLVKAFRRWLQT